MDFHEFSTIFSNHGRPGNVDQTTVSHDKRKILCLQFSARFVKYKLRSRGKLNLCMCRLGLQFDLAVGLLDWGLSSIVPPWETV